ncbi:MAG: DUF2905 domain-containing protein [Nitrospirae bacterium]|nr:DUF2905 domain-containing protein [Nitrospirota bacterium]
MEDWTGLGRVLIFLGIVLVLAGALFTVLGKGYGPGGFGQFLGQFLGWFGKLPGDILIKRDQFTLYVPLATSVVISIVVSLLLYLWSKR